MLTQRTSKTENKERNCRNDKGVPLFDLNMSFLPRRLNLAIAPHNFVPVYETRGSPSLSLPRYTYRATIRHW